MAHLQQFRQVPQSPEKVPGVAILKATSVKPVLVAILQQTLYSHWWDILDLQLARPPSSRSLLGEIYIVERVDCFKFYFVKMRHLGISRPFSAGKNSWWKTGLAEHRTSLWPWNVDEMREGRRMTPVLSYYELLASLAPAPTRVCGRDGEVRHVGVVKQVVHPLPDWLRSDLSENENWGLTWLSGIIIQTCQSSALQSPILWLSSVILL